MEGCGFVVVSRAAVLAATAVVVGSVAATVVVLLEFTVGVAKFEFVELVVEVVVADVPAKGLQPINIRLNKIVTIKARKGLLLLPTMGLLI